MNRWLICIAALTALVWSCYQQELCASVSIYHNQPDWEAAVGGQSNVTVFHFDGPTELHGMYANDTAVVPSYSSQGVDFLPFTGSTVYPVILRGQGWQIPDPTRDGLLGNSSTPNPVSDLDGRAIKFDFNIATNAVGVYTNHFLNGDGGYLKVLDSSLSEIGQVDLSPGVFGGLIADQPISRVEIVNTYNSDILFGIWDLQFSRSVIPELKIISVESGICHLEWTPTGSYYLEYDSSPAFDSVIGTVDVGDTVTEYDYNAGSATKGFFRLVPR